MKCRGSITNNRAAIDLGGNLLQSLLLMHLDVEMPARAGERGSLETPGSFAVKKTTFGLNEKVEPKGGQRTTRAVFPEVPIDIFQDDPAPLPESEYPPESRIREEKRPVNTDKPLKDLTW